MFPIYPVIRRTDSYWTYADEYANISMKIRIVTKSFQISDGLGREKKDKYFIFIYEDGYYCLVAKLCPTLLWVHGL